MIKLRYNLNGENITKELNEGNYIIGRSKNCDIVIRDPSISGQHLRIDITGSEVNFRDLLSRNGTVLNGNKVTQGHLSNGDVLRLGHMEVAIEGASEVVSEFDLPADDFDLAPAPEPIDNEYAVAELEPAGVNEVQVFRAPVNATITPAASEQTERKSRVPVLIGLCVLVAGFIGWSFYSEHQKKQRAIELSKRVPPSERYWKDMNNGAQEFALGNYQQAIDLWQKGEQRYENISGNRMRVGKLFAQAATPYLQAKQGQLIDQSINWNDLRMKLLKMVDDNILSVELRDFAIDFEAKSRKEVKAQKLFTEAASLHSERKWDEAINAYNQVPPDSLYYAAVNTMINKVNAQRLATLKDESISAAKSGNFPEAIKKAEVFFANNGKDLVLAESLNNWRNKLFIEREIRKIRKFSREAVSAAEIESARQIAKNLSQRFPDDADVLSEMPGVIDELNSRLFVVQLEQMYRTGDTVGLEKHLKSGAAHKDNAEAKEILRRWDEMQRQQTEAAAFEQKGNIEEALKHWKVMLITEKDPDNRYREYAANKLKQYPPEVMGNMMTESALRAMSQEKYRQARDFIEKAEGYGVDVSGAQKALQRKGNLLFNKGIQAYSNKEFSLAYKLVNDGRDCFSPDEDFHVKIEAWMQRNNVAVRKPQP